MKNYDEAEGSYKFLHKDYLGSILAISDEEGNKLEQRHYDAWGNLTHLQIGDGEIITDDKIIHNSSLIIDRGYTSHEHFFEVGIIHMNGRLYDPLLRRFLNADENIQDPHNTQNYNKYGYVFNNPLMYNDPSGEFIFAPLAAFLGSKLLAAAVIGAGVGLVSYTVGLAVTGNIHQWSIGGALKATIFGGIGGAVSFGVGSIFSNTAGTLTTFATNLKETIGGVGLAIVQAGTHAVSQGILGLMQGESFGSASLSGFLGSLGASGFGAVAGDWAGKAGGQIFFGSLSGGIGAELSGGNFWQGAVTGGIVAGLNHVAHMEKVVQDPPKEFNLKDFLLDLFTGGEASQIKRTFSNKSINDEKVALQAAVVIFSEYYATYGSGYLGKFKFPKLKVRNVKTKVQFGKTDNQIYHTFRHTDQLGISRDIIKTRIESHLQLVHKKIETSKPYNGIITIGKQKLQYTAYKLDNGIINIGRIHGVK